jgi:two-component system sensor histidine kinase KdpD
MRNETQSHHETADPSARGLLRGSRYDADPAPGGILVAVDGSGQSEQLVRFGMDLAARRQAAWAVVTVDTGTPADDARQAQLDRAFTLARQLGGEAVVLHGDSVADTLLAHAALSGASALLLGQARERPVARRFKRTLTQQLIERSGHMDLIIVSRLHADASSEAPLPPPGGGITATDVGLAAAAAALATLLGWLAERWTGLDDLSLIFIVAVVVVAARSRMAAAVLTSLLCFMAYTFVFIEPRYTFHVGASQGLTTVLLFLVAALVAGRLASRLRMQVLALQEANAYATALQALGRRLATAAGPSDVAAAASYAFRHTFDADATVDLAGCAGQEEGLAFLPAKEREAARRAVANCRPAGRFGDEFTDVTWWFIPLQDGHVPVGAIGLKFAATTVALTVGQRRLAEAMADDVARAVSRARLAAQLEEARVSGQSEQLRAALLSSVSHDLRSPLAAIIGAASSLDNYGDAIDATDRRSLLETIRLEGERLDRYIQNLLDMTRLGHGGLTINRDWIGVDELVGSAIGRLQRYQPAARFDVSLPKDAGPIRVHPALVEQALFNVLENGARFSPPGEAVAVDAELVGGVLRIDVSDRGPGIPPAERERVFDMFYSVTRGDRSREGSGLGLAICRGMIGAHGGSVEALDGPHGRGTTIRIILPDALPGALPADQPAARAAALPASQPVSQVLRSNPNG